MAYRRTAQIQARLDAQRAVIVAAAADLLADGGYAGCSVNRVAARSGVAAGTVYNHFDSKARLLGEVFRTMVEREVDVVREASSDGAPIDRVTAVIETFAGRALKNPRRAYALLAEPVDPLVEELRLAFRLAFRDVMASAISAGVNTATLPPQDPTIVAAALVGAIAEALVGPLASGVEDPSTIPTLVAFARRAVGGDVDAHA